MAAKPVGISHTGTTGWFVFGFQRGLGIFQKFQLLRRPEVIGLEEQDLLEGENAFGFFIGRLADQLPGFQVAFILEQELPQ
jgi:hypothetical protein